MISPSFFGETHFAGPLVCFGNDDSSSSSKHVTGSIVYNMIRILTAWWPSILENKLVLMRGRRFEFHPPNSDFFRWMVRMVPKGSGHRCYPQIIPHEGGTIPVNHHPWLMEQNDHSMVKRHHFAIVDKPIFCLIISMTKLFWGVCVELPECPLYTHLHFHFNIA